MAKWVHVAWIVLVACSCGGPPVGSKIPKANTKKMAIGAAAAATALTLVNPNAARHPESAGEQQPKRIKKTGESVPAGVLDRLDTKSDDDEPCESDESVADNASAEASSTDVVPTVVNETREARDRERREKCRDQAESAPEE